MPTIASPSPVSAALNEIENAARYYKAAREVLALRVERYDAEIASINRRLLPGIRSGVSEAADKQQQLVNAIAAHPDLFVQPRTMTLHGIKLGFQKGKGSIDWADDEKVSAKIADLLPEQFQVLVKTTHKPVAKALQTLDVAMLRKLGCTVESTGDAVFVKAADSEVDKLVAKILKEGAVEEAAPEAKSA